MTATDPWFRPRTYGYGAYPLNWKGWAATAAYVIAVLAFTWPYVGSEAIPPAGWWAALAALTAAFVWLCYAKTAGTWRWRWGETDDGGA